MLIEDELDRLHIDPLERMLRTVAQREGVLLKFLDNDPETVRLVETHAGAALAQYEATAQTSLTATVPA